ncbi:unnamed protein product [Trichogramma brassicae]|uniref:Uncharacterized protein n=1 Tax=Trichogramma brassicae TaxID=86971 RepID=A0A6H5J6W3_9HYME|nr:unnamed protein product [Trichogramma brassicae]
MSQIRYFKYRVSVFFDSFPNPFVWRRLTHDAPEHLTTHRHLPRRASPGRASAYLPPDSPGHTPAHRHLPRGAPSPGRASASATRATGTHARASAPATRCVITRSCIGTCHPTHRDTRPRIGTCHAVQRQLYHVRPLRHRSHEERPSCAPFAAHTVFTEPFVSGADAPAPPASPSEPFLRAGLPPLH